MTRRELLDAATIPAWLTLFVLLGALLGFVAWALDWIVQVVRSYL